MSEGHQLRSALHYVVATVIITIYGGQVCPFIQSINITKWALLLTIVFLLTYMLRHLLVKRVVDSAAPTIQVKRQFIVEMAMFLTAGMVILLFNTIEFDFPVASGLKIVLAAATLGFFAATDLALCRERTIYHHMLATGDEVEASNRFFPLTRKITIVAMLTVFFVTGVVFLVVAHDFLWVMSEGVKDLKLAHRAILVEMIFIGLVVLGELINLIKSFTTNLTLFFGNQNNALTAVTAGNLEAKVTVSANDEFGVMGRYTNAMIKRLKERTEELAITRDVTILSLATLAETRDNETGAHILRTQRYLRAIAIELQRIESQEELTDNNIDLLYKSAPLHDIGKVGIPDAILLKPGKLTDDEFKIMKRHAYLGYQALENAENSLGESSFLHYAREIAYSHHEKWDGGGYPRRLSGTDIPLSGRLMAVADVYDALISKRVYKPAFPHEKAMEIITEGRGTHFDPEVVDAFLAIETEVKEIAAEYGDEHTK